MDAATDDLPTAAEIALATHIPDHVRARLEGIVGTGMAWVPSYARWHTLDLDEIRDAAISAAIAAHTHATCDHEHRQYEAFIRSRIYWRMRDYFEGRQSARIDEPIHPAVASKIADERGRGDTLTPPDVMDARSRRMSLLARLRRLNHEQRRLVIAYSRGEAYRDGVNKGTTHRKLQSALAILRMPEKDWHAQWKRQWRASHPVHQRKKRRVRQRPNTAFLDRLQAILDDGQPML